jgi:hypothetical protein
MAHRLRRGGVSPVTLGLICGGITVAALCGVMGQLDDYQVQNWGDNDPVIGIFGGLIAGFVAAMLILIGHQRPTRHAVVPLILVPGVLGPLTMGLERDRLEAALLWSAVAVGVHLLLATRPVRTAVPLVALAVLLGAGVTWAAQERWRAHEFNSNRGRLYVPEVPGYRMVGAHPGSYSTTVRLEKADRSGGVEGVVEWAQPPCPKPTSPPRAFPEEERPAICLPSGFIMRLFPDEGTTLPAAEIRVRRATGGELARLPDHVHYTEAD